MQLEEGEIESENESIEEYTAIPLDPYTPLERPDFGPLNQVPPKEEEVESDKKDSSSENSDDDLGPKRPKLRRVNQSRTKNKYRIWCKDPNEHLTDFLDTFGMRNPENDRNVENYTVPNCVIYDRKRKIPQRRHENNEELTPLEIDDLETTESNSYEEVAKDIAAKLFEPNYELVLRIVTIIGKDKAIEFYNKTKSIEKDGGLLIANQSRRRTSGGVFIMLVRTSKDISRSQRNEIFEESRLESQARKASLKKKRKKKKMEDWAKEMSNVLNIESGHEVLTNPPPSPEPQPPENIPELPLRRDLVSYGDLNLTPPNSVGPAELTYENNQIDSSPEYNSSPVKSLKPSETRGLEDDEVDSMDLIYD